MKTPVLVRILFAAAATSLLSAASSDQGGAPSPGLIGIVFDNPALAKPVRVWTVAEPRVERFEPIARHDYSLSLRGQLRVPFRGPFEIQAQADDGLRLRLGGRTLIGGPAPGGARTGSAPAAGREPLPLEIDYFQDGGPAKLALLWRAAGTAEWTPIPADAFSFTAEDRRAVEERFASLRDDYERLVVRAKNPRPDRWPTLQLVQQGVRPLLRAVFPGAADFACDAWMYESEVDLIDARDAGDGVLEVRHRLRPPAAGVIVSTVRPGEGAVEVVARLEGAADTAPALDLCWQLRGAPKFAAYPETYAKFPARCFIFTAAGRTFLDRTTRLPTARFPADDPVNQPPWVQNYLPSWRDAPAAGTFSWAGTSPDRFTASVAGVVSRDGLWLAAIANDSATLISQVWIDCLHNNPGWHRPAGGGAPEWRLKIYLLPNDPAALLRRVGEDFPAISAQPAFAPAVAARDRRASGTSVDE
ncbi:MAG TPA: hypothetical protein VGD97_07635 [Lacunisphaera sp.]